MIEESLLYHAGSIKCIGRLFTQDKSKRPIILVAHTWKGQDKFAIEKAKWLAELGYVGIAIDIFGEAKQAKNDEEANQLIEPLFINRKELRKRMIAALEAARALEWADTASIGAIGFCFGGLAVIELIRSGAPLKGIVSFHGLLGDIKGDKQADTLPTEKIMGSLLILHGFHDPMVPWETVKKFCDEMVAAKADWEIDVYDASHAFTNPEALDPNSPLRYNEKVANLAYARMKAFFQNLFKK